MKPAIGNPRLAELGLVTSNVVRALMNRIIPAVLIPRISWRQRIVTAPKDVKREQVRNYRKRFGGVVE